MMEKFRCAGGPQHQKRASGAPSAIQRTLSVRCLRLTWWLLSGKLEAQEVWQPFCRSWPPASPGVWFSCIGMLCQVVGVEEERKKTWA